MKIKYHKKSIKLLEIKPQISNSAIEKLDKIEIDYNFSLPASIREWYSIDGALGILYEYSNQDTPLPIDEWLEERKDTKGDGPYNLFSQNLIPFKYENQAVCIWAIQIHGSDDPPVVVDVNSQFKSWLHCSDTFSNYVYSCIWDYKRVLNDRCSILSATVEPITESELKFLNDKFNQELITYGWPGHTQYRFYREDKAILLWVSDDQTDWYLSAETDQSLETLAREVWHLSSLSENLYGISENEEKIIKKIRNNL